MVEGLGLNLPEPAVNITYRGIVEEIKFDQSSRILGLKVLFYPGRTGMVFWRTVPRGTLERYQKGEQVVVQFTATQRTENGFTRYDLVLVNPK